MIRRPPRSTLFSLHDALPISDHPSMLQRPRRGGELEDLLYVAREAFLARYVEQIRSEEHTSELQSRQYLVCRLLLEKKKKMFQAAFHYHRKSTQYYSHSAPNC